MYLKCPHMKAAYRFYLHFSVPSEQSSWKEELPRHSFVRKINHFPPCAGWQHGHFINGREEKTLCRVNDILTRHNVFI